MGGMRGAGVVALGWALGRMLWYAAAAMTSALGCSMRAGVIHRIVVSTHLSSDL
jgi:hypothetical protein